MEKRRKTIWHRYVLFAEPDATFSGVNLSIEVGEDMHAYINIDE